MPPRLAFAGSPRSVSPWLLHAISRIGIFEAICGEDAEREITRFQARWAFESDLSAMLKEAEPDGVILACAPSERSRLIKECLTAGAGVLAIGAPGTMAACKRLAVFAKLAGRFVLSAPAIRFSPSLLMARRLIDSGKLGMPVSVSLNSTRRSSTPDSADSGPMSFDQIFEAVDLVHHLTGSIQRGFAMTHPDGAMVVSASAGNQVPVSMVFHANGASDAVGIELEIRASDGTRLRIGRDGGLICANGPQVSASRQVTLAEVEPLQELGYEGLTAEFRRHLEAGRSSLGLIGPVMEVTAGTEAILASAAKGRAVTPKIPSAESRDAAKQDVAGKLEIAG
ncbi:MAG: hypothetical protein MI923_01265 [Phycisphaerales bacterium]|nr:hypothetical protein [Phycisphaerales bacterium]